MSEQEKKLDGPDSAEGVALADLAESAMILGHVAGDAVLLARRGHELFTIGAECTHYHGPLAEGLLVEDTVRCPWHHACFSLRTGEALRAPALNPVPCWRVEFRNGTVYVREKGRADSGRSAADTAVGAGDHRDCRRRGGRGSRGGDATASGLSRLDHDVQR